MKRIFTSLIVILALSSFTNPNNLLGKWQVLKVGFENGAVVDVQEKWISFQKDGEILSGKIGNSASMEGIWEFNCPGNSVSIQFDSNQNTNGDFTIQHLNESTLVLSRDSMKVYLQKIK